MDDNHLNRVRYAYRMAGIVCSESFLALKNELEKLYNRNGIEHASQSAFQDALYSIIEEKDLKLLYADLIKN